MEQKGVARWPLFALGATGVAGAVVMKTALPAVGALGVLFLVRSLAPRFLLTLDRLRAVRPVRGPVEVKLRPGLPLRRAGNVVIIDGLRIRSAPSEPLETLVRLLCTEWFVGCRTEASKFLLSPARRSGEAGWLLALQSGVLFVPEALIGPAQERLAGSPLPLTLSADRFLLLLAHLAPARFEAVVNALEELDADWLPVGETALSRDEESHSVLLSSGLVQLQVSFALDSAGQALANQLCSLLGAARGAAGR